MLFKFLKDNATLLLLLAAIGVLWFSNGRLESQRDAARADLRAERVLTDSLSASLERQNEGVRALADAAEGNREVYLAGLEAANRRAIRLEIDAEEILALPSPSTPNEQCEAAHALLLAD